MKETSLDLRRAMRAIEEEKREEFSRFQALLLEYNQKFNLTAVVETREILFKHFLDSLAGEGFFPENSTVAEVGSGAGFPSLPLKIVREDLTFALFESVGKKCNFLKTAVKELRLGGTEVHQLRAEEAGKGEFREKFDVCCARAVARMNTLAEYCLPLVRVGGRFIAYKGDVGEELLQAERAISLLGGRVETVAKYALPEGMGERTVVVVEKIGSTPRKYPRGRGKERSEPIV